MSGHAKQLMEELPLLWSNFFVKSKEKTKLQLIPNKASRYGFLPAYVGTIDELFESSDDTLFTPYLIQS